MKPGKPPNWGPGAESGVGTAIGVESCVWFTMAKGCVTETFYPRPDLAHTRCIFLMVTGRDGFFSDERLHTIQKVCMPAPGGPLFEAVNHCCHDRYRITKTIATDPYRDVLIQRVRFDPIAQREILKLWVFLVPAVENEAYGNDASIDPAGQCLIARRANFAIALTTSCGFSRRGCFYQGPDDLWSRLKNGMAVTDFPDHAEDANVLLAGEVDYRESGGEFIVA